MPSKTDSDEIVWKRFCVYIWGKNNTGGGADNMRNDCLFKCIVEVINYDEIPEGFKPAYQFKRRLKLERDDKISIFRRQI